MECYLDFKEQYEKNKAIILEKFKNDIYLSTALFNKILFLSNRYIMRFFLGIGHNLDQQDIITSTIYKSLYNLEAIIDLTIRGKVGPARIIMRNVFEFLVIGKYMILEEDNLCRERWDNINHINLDNKIFKKIIYPNNKNKEAFVKWWKMLCQLTHATKMSGQADFEYEDLKKQIKINFTFILILLCMLYHYMNIFLATPYLKSYIKSLDNDQSENDNLHKAVIYEKEVKELIKIMNSTFSPECKQIIMFYRAKWEFDIVKYKNI